MNQAVTGHLDLTVSGSDLVLVPGASDPRLLPAILGAEELKRLPGRIAGRLDRDLGRDSAKDARA